MSGISLDGGLPRITELVYNVCQGHATEAFKARQRLMWE